MTILRGHFTPIRTKLIACDRDDGWVEGTLATIHETLRSPQPPVVNENCEYCRYAASSAGAAHSAR